MKEIFAETGNDGITRVWNILYSGPLKIPDPELLVDFISVIEQFDHLVGSIEVYKENNKYKYLLKTKTGPIIDLGGVDQILFETCDKCDKYTVRNPNKRYMYEYVHKDHCPYKMIEDIIEM